MNAEKPLFAKNLEYFCFKMTKEAIMSLPDKVQAIKNLAVPKTKRQLRSFVGLINYCKDMWKYSSF